MGEFSYDGFIPIRHVDGFGFCEQLLFLVNFTGGRWKMFITEEEFRTILFDRDAATPRTRNTAQHTERAHR